MCSICCRLSMSNVKPSGPIKHSYFQTLMEHSNCAHAHLPIGANWAAAGFKDTASITSWRSRDPHQCQHTYPIIQECLCVYILCTTLLTRRRYQVRFFCCSGRRHSAGRLDLRPRSIMASDVPRTRENSIVRNFIYLYVNKLDKWTYNKGSRNDVVLDFGGGVQKFAVYCADKDEC